MLFNAIYIEKEAENLPLTESILARYPDIPKLSCEHYGEIFNRNKQNFKIQKNNPSLILAKKLNQRIHKTPMGYGIGGENNYYFSHMYNCIYDCRYCFLQGMYRSANYVVFVNQKDFIHSMEEILYEHPNEDVYFFSGYDCDSLALEPITHFTESTLPFFEANPRAFLELRTKSTQISFLLKRKPLPNVIVAYTLSPENIVKEIEHKTPSLDRRIKALSKLTKTGWKVGLRLDPLIYQENYLEAYEELFQKLFSSISCDLIHSVTLGPFRLPKKIYKKMSSLYPSEKLFYHKVIDRGSMFSYTEDLEKSMQESVLKELKRYIAPELIYHMPLTS